jgi:hypothetical protein
LILVGLILLLPGLCSLIFSAMLLKDAGSVGLEPGIQLLLFLCFVVGAVGVSSGAYDSNFGSARLGRGSCSIGRRRAGDRRLVAARRRT